MALPASRNTDYSNGTPVLPADLDALQDMIVALNKLLTNQAQAVWAAPSFNAPLTFNANVTTAGTAKYKHTNIETIPIPGSAFRPITSATAVDYSANGCMFTGGLGVVAPVVIPQGRRFVGVSGVRFYIRDNVTGPSTLQCAFSRMDTVGGGNAQNAGGSAGSGADQTINVNPNNLGLLLGSVIAGNSQFLRILYLAGSAQCRIYMAELDFDF